MKSLISIAKKYYSDIPYHNFKHALKVMKNCEKLIKRCKKYKLKVNEQVVLISALFHDAGYQDKTKFKTKERYSANIAEKELKKLNYNSSFIKKVKKCILATEKDGKFITNEEKILRAADLMGLAGSYKEFKENSKLIEKEYSFLYKGEFPLDKWIELMNYYFEQRIKLTPEFEKDKFHNKFKKNVERYLKLRRLNLF